MDVSAILDQMIADPAINGQHVDVDHEFGGQCWDLVELFAERIGVPKEPWAITLGPLGAAKEAWTVFDGHMQAYFDKIPAGQEQKGDISVYDGHGVYTEGHIAINLGDGQVFEENADPDGAPVHVSPRATTYLLGSLRLKGGSMEGTIQNQGQADLLFAVALHKVDQAGAAGFIGMTWSDALTKIEQATGPGSHDDQDQILTVAAGYTADSLRSALAGTLTKQSVIQYINDKLQ